MTKLLTFASIVEIGTGLALMLDPRLVVGLLVGENAASDAALLGRFLGIALLAFGVACASPTPRSASGSPAFWGMLIYNALVSVYLTYLARVGHVEGPLLWPAIALHGVVALLLVWIWRGERRGATRRISPRRL